MPVPTPNKGETRESYISRCMRQLSKTDADRPQKQRAAMCYSKWRDHNQDNMIVVHLDDGKHLLIPASQYYKETNMAKLTTKARKALPKSAFCDPEGRRYPAHDKAHIRNGLARIQQNKNDPKYSSIKACLLRRAKAAGIKSTVKSEDDYPDEDFAIVASCCGRMLQWAEYGILNPELLYDSLVTIDHMSEEELPDNMFILAKQFLLNKAEAYIKTMLGE